MRVTTALLASVALHGGLVALPVQPLLPDSGSVEDNATLSVDLPSGSGASKTPGHTEPVNSAVRVSATAPGRNSAEQFPLNAPQASTLALPLPHYYGPREVGERAQPVGDDLDKQPPAIVGFPGSGKLVLVLYVNESGRVDKVDVVNSDLESVEVEQLLVDQFGKAKFKAARLDGLPVKSRLKIEIVVTPPVPAISPPN